MRAPVAACIAALLAVSLACAKKPESISPFTFYERPDMRAGIAYAEMDAAANRESIGKFTCQPLWAGGRRCQIMIDPGMLIATVNGKGRVVHLKIETKPSLRGYQYDSRTWARVEFNQTEFVRMREAWSTVSDPTVTAWARGTAIYRWVDDQSRWTGGMWYNSYYSTLGGQARSDLAHYQDTLAALPDSVVTIDEFGFEEYLAQQPAEGGRKPSKKGPPADPLGRMQFDLAMVVSAQAEYFEDRARYAMSPDALIFLAGDGVRVEIRDVTRTGWSAVATHDALPGMTCVVYGGTVASPPRTPKGIVPAAEQVACDAG
jgi:hypothetical protein